MKEVQGILEMMGCEGEGKYLGLPYMVGRTKKHIFQYLKERVAKKVKG